MVSASFKKASSRSFSFPSRIVECPLSGVEKKFFDKCLKVTLFIDVSAFGLFQNYEILQINYISMNFMYAAIKLYILMNFTDDVRRH